MELSVGMTGSASGCGKRLVSLNPVVPLACFGVLQLALLVGTHLKTLKWVLRSNKTFS